MTADKIVFGEQARAAHDGFIQPAFDILRAQYAIKLADTASSEPWAHEKITALAHAIKVLDGVQGQVQSIVTDGKIERDNMKRAEQVANIRASKRRILGLG